MQSSITGNGTTHIYYNISITNNDVTGLNPPPAIDFNETRTQPFINNPSEYFMSVVRFSLDTSTLPLMSPQPQVNPTTPGDLVYSITLKKGNFSYQQYLNFIPQTLEIPQPPYPLSNSDVNSRYWELYSYQWWNNIVNNAFRDATAGLNALIGGVVTAPFMIWDSSGYTAILNTDSAYFDQTPGVLAEPVYIYFNSPMWVLYSSYEAEYIGQSTNIENGENFKLIVFNQQGQNEYTNTTTGITYMQTYQEYSTSPLWNPIQSIVFTTNLLPIVPEMTAAPTSYTGSGFQSSGNNANLTNTLTDFEVVLEKGSEYKPTINYTPAGEYRLTDLFGTSPVNALNVNIYWKNRFGGLNPVTLSAGSSANIKMMFRRKDFSNLVM
jgi:hypothetical protein